MNITVSPKKLNGTITAISSKSCVHRLLICASLSDHPTIIKLNGSMTTRKLSKDILATIDCLTSLGANIEFNPANDLEIKVAPIEVVPQNPVLNCKESGSTLRFLLPVAAALLSRCKTSGIPINGITFLGEGRLPDRPISDLCAALKHGGINFSSESLPLTISGTLQSGTYNIAGNVSSQYITGLLLGLSFIDNNRNYINKELENNITESKIILSTKLESSAYVDITINVLKTFGIDVIKRENEYIISRSSDNIENHKICENDSNNIKTINADGDWSNAAFFLTLKAMGHDINVTGLDDESPQGDKAISTLLFNALHESFNCNTKEIDVSEIPDLLPILATYAMFLRKPIKFVGGSRLRIKESDRITSVTEMINDIGGIAEEFEDGLFVTPKVPTGGIVDSCNDHRIVMSAAVAGTKSQGSITIKNAEAVNKSYPTFFEDLKKLGGIVNVE